MQWTEQAINDTYALTGSRIREARKRRKWNQADLADEIGLTRSSVANVEAGRQRLLLHGLLRIAVALDVPTESLLPSTHDLGADLPAAEPSTPDLSGQSDAAHDFVTTTLRRAKRGVR